MLRQNIFFSSLFLSETPRGQASTFLWGKKCERRIIVLPTNAWIGSTGILHRPPGLLTKGTKSQFVEFNVVFTMFHLCLKCQMFPGILIFLSTGLKDEHGRRGPVTFKFTPCHLIPGWPLLLRWQILNHILTANVEMAPSCHNITFH